MYIDESGIDDNEFCPYGWAPKGKRLFANKQAFKKMMISIIGALNRGKMRVLCIFEGYSDSELFEVYVENVLVSILKPGQTVIMDNASFHKSAKTRKLIENAGCNVLFYYHIQRI